ncbi:MAG: (2Fe-2S)-binding protein [Chloroflexi bacterium]|nr:(2Fe-2S)-binding protein [Chloroflexota bacterium]|tara:strand:- start:8542 stop:9855 length:1314 start_codon:yes stop_codon:yes gene_type:complete
MLSVEQNEKLTRVGPGTPMGELMRRYWHPIAASSELNAENPTKEVRLLGEDLVLYRDAKGTLGLIEPSCAHRKASLAYGVPEENGIRCAYHGWIFNEDGQCVDQPSEPEGSKFKEKVRIKAYKAQELGGAIFAYMGPEPAPLLPRVDVLVWHGIRRIQTVNIPCNWLQCHENSLDPLHFQWLHRYWGGWIMNKKLSQEDRDTWNSRIASRGQDHRKIGFEITDYGVIKRRLVADDDEDSEWWKMGHPILFPNILHITSNLQYRVPIDDTHTMHFVVDLQTMDESVEVPDVVEHTEIPCFDEDGKIKADWVLGQDQAAWIMQGPITDRSTERLGVSDVGIIMFRRLLDEQMEIVAQGGDPMNIIRDEAENEILIYPVEHFEYPGYQGRLRGPFQDITVNNNVEQDLSGAGVTLPEWEGVEIADPRKRNGRPTRVGDVL